MASVVCCFLWVSNVVYAARARPSRELVRLVQEPVQVVFVTLIILFICSIALSVFKKTSLISTTQNSILRPSFRTLSNYSPVHHIITHFTRKALFLSISRVLQQLRNKPFYLFLLTQEQSKRCINVTT
jgi:hypothetical protein